MFSLLVTSFIINQCFFFQKTQWVTAHQNRVYCILPLDLDKQRGTRIYKNKILYFYSLTEILVWSRRVVWENLYTEGAARSWNDHWKLNFNQHTRLYIVFKLPYDPHSHASLSGQCLFFIGHGLHPCNAYFSLVKSITPTYFSVSRITPTHFCFPGSHLVDFIYDQMYLSNSFVEFAAG